MKKIIQRMVPKITGRQEIVRPDGLKVFINENDPPIINEIRLYEKDKRKVILAVGIFRGLQIAEHYSRQYGEGQKFTNLFKKISGSGGKL